MGVYACEEATEDTGSSGAVVTSGSRPSLFMCALTEHSCSGALPEFGRHHSLDQLMDHEVTFKDHIQH